jgi:WD40 repeat protein
MILSLFSLVPFRSLWLLLLLPSALLASGFQEAMARGIQSFEGHRDLSRAERAYSRALEIASNRHQTAEAADMLGRTFLAQGREREGTEMLRRSRREWEKFLVPSQMNQAWKQQEASWLLWTPKVDATDWERYESVLKALVEVGQSTGQLEYALETLDRLVAIRSQRLHPAHRFVGTLQALRGDLLVALGHVSAARQAYQRALGIAKVSDYPSTVRELERKLQALQTSTSGDSHARHPSTTRIQKMLSWLSGDSHATPNIPGPRPPGPGELFNLVHSSSVEELAFSLDGTRLATLTQAQGAALRIWDTSSGKPLAEVPGQYNQAGLAFDRQGHVYVAKDGDILVLDRGGSSVSRWESSGFITRLAVAPDAGILVAAVSNRSRASLSGLEIWSLTTGKCLRTLPVPAPLDFFSHLGVSDAGDIYFSYSKLGLWHYPRETVLADLSPGNPPHPDKVPGGEGWFRSMAVSPDGQWVTLRTSTHRPKIYLPEKREMQYLPDVGAVAGMVPLGRRRQVLVSDFAWRIRVLEIDSGKVLHTFLGHGDVAEGLTVSRKGEMAASGGRDGRVILWDLR